MGKGRRRVRVAGLRVRDGADSGDTPRKKRAMRGKVVAILTTAGVVVGLATGLLTLLDRTGATVSDVLTDPLAVNVRYTGSDGQTGSAVVVPEGTHVDPQFGGSIQAAIEHYANHGGYVPKNTVFNVRLTGMRAEPVAVTRIRAVQVRHRPPVNGTYLHSPGQGAGDVVPVRIDLDRGSPEIDARRMQPAEQPGDDAVEVGPYPGRHRGDLTLGKGENARIEVQAIARKHAAQFKIAIDTLVGGEPQDPIIVDTQGADGSGEPFRVTAVCRPGSQPITYHDGYIWTGGLARSPKQTIERMSPEELAGPGLFEPHSREARERWCTHIW